MKINLSIKIIGGFISSLILVLIICAFYYNYAKKLKDSILKGEEIQIKINQIERIASLVKDAETGQRGYIITKDESYLAPYKQSLIALDHQMKLLNNGLSDFNETDFELLSLRLKEKLSELSYTIELTKEGNYDSAQAIVLSNKGKIIMDKIRAICSQMENRERNYFEASQKEIEDNWNRSAVWLFIGFTFIIILLILNIFQIVSKVNRNKLLQKEIVLKNKELTEAYKELESHNEEFVALNEELNSNIEELRAANDTISEYSKELELSRDYYTTILHDFPALIWRADTASMCNYFNNSWINFTGRTPEQEYGRGWMEGIHQEDLKTYIDIYEDALSKKQSFVIEYRLRRYDGQNRWVINFGKPLFDINNNFEGYLGACFDIQDKKEFEKEIYAKNQELSQALEELKSTEEHLISLNNNLEERVLERTRELKEIAENYQMQGSVLESMTEGVSISDELGYIIYTNPAEDQIFGYEKGELIGKHVTVQNTYEPEENERIVNEVIEQLKNKGSWIGEFNNKKKNGTHFTTRARINSIKINENIYLVCVQEDITEEKKVKEELQDKNKQLVKINADLDNFIYTASHDLKSPISNIEGLTHALNKKLSDKLDDSERNWCK